MWLWNTALRKHRKKTHTLTHNASECTWNSLDLLMYQNQTSIGDNSYYSNLWLHCLWVSLVTTTQCYFLVTAEFTTFNIHNLRDTQAEVIYTRKTTWSAARSTCKKAAERSSEGQTCSSPFEGEHTNYKLWLKTLSAMQGGYSKRWSDSLR